jgi:hypothetical protein
MKLSSILCASLVALAALALAADGASAATNLNSSKSNAYRKAGSEGCTMDQGTGSEGRMQTVPQMESSEGRMQTVPQMESMEATTASKPCDKGKDMRHQRRKSNMQRPGQTEDVMQRPGQTEDVMQPTPAPQPK